MDVTLLLIATDSMLSTENFPHYGKIWEDLRKDKKDWSTCKTLYKSADHKAKVNK